MSLPQIILALRKTYKYSELATIVSVSENTIRRWEKGFNKPHSMLIEKLNDLLLTNQQEANQSKATKKR